MFLKKRKEFQYHPAIIKMLKDVVGGGTIIRADLANAIFDGVALDELPPYVLAGKNSNGGYVVLKTATVTEDVESDGVSIKVAKNHLFGVGDFICGSALSGKSDKITAIDKSNDDYDTLTIEAAVGAISEDDVIVSVNAKAAAGSAAAKMDLNTLAITVAKVDLTKANQSCGLMVRGTINEANMPFSLDATLKAKLPFVRFE